ncbi:MAG: hypothetical protein Q9211_001943 [Gyalolechia sp. 1 TL-2023]
MSSLLTHTSVQLNSDPTPIYLRKMNTDMYDIHILMRACRIENQNTSEDGQPAAENTASKSEGTLDGRALSHLMNGGAKFSQAASQAKAKADVMPTNTSADTAKVKDDGDGSEVRGLGFVEKIACFFASSCQVTKNRRDDESLGPLGERQWATKYSKRRGLIAR